MNMFLNVTIIAATILIVSSARADDTSGKALADVRAGPGYATAVEAAARASATWTVNPCLDAKMRLGDTTIVDAPQREATGSVTTGRWIEHVVMQGCMTERDLNVAVEATANGLAFRPTLPGSTRAPLRLQETLTTKAFAAAGMDPSGCSPTYVLGADYDRHPRSDEDDDDDDEEKTAPPGWREQWIVVQCGLRAAVSVDFPADPDRGEIVMRLVKRAAP